MFGANENMPVSLMCRASASMQVAVEQTHAAKSKDRGASMVEYGLLLVLVLLVAFFTVQVFGESLVALFDTSANTLDSAPNVNPEG